jgi:DNA mismatch repair protein MutS2
MLNAAMEFDHRSLMPLYRLTAGEPGESHAIETARRYGIPGHVIEMAQGMVGRIGSEFQALLAELKIQRQAFEERLRELENRGEALAAQERALKDRLDEEKERSRAAMEKALRDARELVQSTRHELNQILDEARREKREASARERLQAKERQVEEKLRAVSGELPLAPGEIAPGSRVQVRSLGCTATVLKVDRRHGRLRVQAGSLEMDIPLDDLAAPVSAGKEERRRQARSPAEHEEPGREINLIGLRVEEALARLEPFLNHASLAGYGEVRVIHGIGTGALRRGVREHLTGHPLVASFRNGEHYEGGNGATVVTLAA